MPVGGVMIGASLDEPEKFIRRLNNSPLAWKALANNGTFMNTVAASEVAMNAVAASEVAMNAVAASEVAMNAIATSEVALAVIMKSNLASDIIKAVVQNYVGAIKKTLDYSSMFIKEDIDTGVMTNLANGTYIVPVSDVIVIPYEMQPEDDTSFSSVSGLAYGTDPSFKLCEFPIDRTVHTINAVSFRGLVYFTENTTADPYVKYYKYTLAT